MHHGRLNALCCDKGAADWNCGNTWRQSSTLRWNCGNTWRQSNTVIALRCGKGVLAAAHGLHRHKKKCDIQNQQSRLEPNNGIGNLTDGLREL
jgi:hypothetical protein